MSGFETKAAPLIAWMRGAARRDGAALLGAPSFSHARMPPTNEAEGDAKEEGAGAKHGGEVKALVSHVKDRRLTKLKLPLGSRSTTRFQLEFSIHYMSRLSLRLNLLLVLAILLAGP